MQSRDDDQRKMNNYNVAAQFYNQELNTINQRNTAFLIVQSILVAAFATLVVNADKFPWALVAFMWAIILAGVLFCFFHHIAGRSGARSTFNWRRYMHHLERGQMEAPWNRFDQYCRESRFENRLLERLPRPHAWIFTPAIFASGWFLAAWYVTIRLCFIEQDPLHVNPYLPLPWPILLTSIVLLVTFIVVVYILWQFITWWRTRITIT